MHPALRALGLTPDIIARHVVRRERPMTTANVATFLAIKQNRPRPSRAKVRVCGGGR